MDFSKEWASYQICKIAACACAGNAGNIPPATNFKENRKLAIPACIMARAWIRWLIRSQGGKLAERVKGVRFTRLKLDEVTFGSRFWKVQTMPFHIPYEILQLALRLSREERDRLILLGSWVSHKVQLTRLWSWQGRLDPQIRVILAIAKGFPHPV